MSNDSNPAPALNLYTIGSVVEYKDYLGGKRLVNVVSRDRYMKNGRPGFTGSLVGFPEMEVWGLDYQIISVPHLA